MKPTEEQIKELCTNYFNLIIECGENEQKRKDFFNNPRPYLNKVGMKIDEDIQVHIDTKTGMGWPSVYIKTKNGQIVVAEKSLGVDVMKRIGIDIDGDGDIDKIIEEHQNINIKPGGEVDIDIDHKLDDCKVLAVIPFFDIRNDPLTEIKFNDETEILLSCC